MSHSDTNPSATIACPPGAGVPDPASENPVRRLRGLAADALTELQRGDAKAATICATAGGGLGALIAVMSATAGPRAIEVAQRHLTAHGQAGLLGYLDDHTVRDGIAQYHPVSCQRRATAAPVRSVAILTAKPASAVPIT